METIVNGWLSIWLYVITGIGIWLGVSIYKNRTTWSKLNIICSLAIIVLVLHVIEEWVFPDGLHYLYNITGGSEYLSGYPMSRLTDMLTNFGGVVLGCITLKCGGFRKPAAIVVLFISAMEVVIHISIAVSSLAIFEEYGQITLYAPGLVTALFGFLPISVVLVKALIKTRPSCKQWVLGILAAIGVCVLCIIVPEQLLADENSTYAFTNRGYYEQFAEKYEQDHGVSYYLEQ